MSAAIFRSDGKTIVNFMSILVSKPAFLTKSRVGQILTISDLRQVNISDFRPALWLGSPGQTGPGFTGLGWQVARWTAGLSSMI